MLLGNLFKSPLTSSFKSLYLRHILMKGGFKNKMYLKCIISSFQLESQVSLD